MFHGDHFTPLLARTFSVLFTSFGFGPQVRRPAASLCLDFLMVLLAISSLFGFVLLNLLLATLTNILMLLLHSQGYCVSARLIALVSLVLIVLVLHFCVLEVITVLRVLLCR